MNIAIFTLTSELHDEQTVNAVTKEFLDSLEIDYYFKGDDYSAYGTHALDLIFVRTGGTEGIFKKLLPSLQSRSSRPFYLLASSKGNSLAASMEILSFLQQHGLKGEIIHGAPVYVSERIKLLARVGDARSKLQGTRLGVIGKPSDWLIASDFDRNRIKDVLGIEIVDIPMQEVLDVVATLPVVEQIYQAPTESIRKSLPGAMKIYQALKLIAERHQLQGFTIRCFDLLSSLHNTGCLALAKLNAEGIVAGCEGDVPAMLTMMIGRALVGVSGFQANPANIDCMTGEILFAHCTIPFNMVKRYEFDTHFESGIGVGIRGFMKEGPVTVFKVSGDLSRCFIEEGELLRSQSKADLCRTQQVIRLSDPANTSYFLTHPIGNHHIILPGHQKQLIEELWKGLME